MGAVITATDPDPNAETPTYTLGGADAAKFRVRANGQIEVGSGTKLDYETKTTYMVTLTAEDSFGSSSSIAVTIMVNNIDEVPEITLGGLAISGMISVEYAENGMDAVATYTAAGPNADMATLDTGWRRRRGLHDKRRDAHLQWVRPTTRCRRTCRHGQHLHGDGESRRRDLHPTPTP